METDYKKLEAELVKSIKRNKFTKSAEKIIFQIVKRLTHNLTYIEDAYSPDYQKGFCIGNAFNEILNVNNYKDFVPSKTTAFVYCSNIIMEILSNSFKNLSNFKNKNK